MLRISPELILNILKYGTNKTICIAHPLPEDTEFVDALFDEKANMICLRLSSSEFTEADYPYIEHTPEFRILE